MHILDTASTAGDAAIAGLLEEPNQADALLPGTNLRLVRELPGTTMLQANRKYRGLIGEMCEVRTSIFFKGDSHGSKPLHVAGSPADIPGGWIPSGARATPFGSQSSWIAGP